MSSESRNRGSHAAVPRYIGQYVMTRLFTAGKSGNQLRRQLPALVPRERQDGTSER